MDNHMEMGKKLLAAGQLADALSHFHAAVGEFQKTEIFYFGFLHQMASRVTVLSLFQREIRKTTWRTTGELQCF